MFYNLSLAIRYKFDRPAGAGRQVLRITPANLPGVQQVLSSAVTITPRPLERHHFTDFFGNEVIEIVMAAGLSAIAINMTARVERLPSGGGMDFSPPLAGLVDELAAFTQIGPHSPHHHLGPSARIPMVPAIASFAANAAAGAQTVREAVVQLGQALNDTMVFDADATEVDTPIAEAFAGRHGVCQDMSQIMIAGLRSLGIPAAYVAGFLRTLPPPGKARLEGADAMHAWVRAWTGNEAGWVEYDPTNACFADTDHIVVGYGRDYADAAPVTGMLRYDGSQNGSHSVDIVAG